MAHPVLRSSQQRKESKQSNEEIGMETKQQAYKLMLMTNVCPAEHNCTVIHIKSLKFWNHSFFCHRNSDIQSYCEIMK
jgi:hypothetical protein